MWLRSVSVLLWIFAVTNVSACRLGTVDSAPSPTATDVRRDYDGGVLFVDVRTDEEWADGHLRSALHLPVDTVAKSAATALPDKSKALILYCASGRRARTAADTLRALGYMRVTAMAGGYKEIKAAGFPIDE